MSSVEEVWVRRRPAEDGLFYAMTCSWVLTGITVYLMYVFVGWFGAAIGVTSGFIITFTLTPHLVAAYFDINIDTLLNTQKSSVEPLSYGVKQGEWDDRNQN